MARVEIELITNLELFSNRVGTLKSFTNIQATVTPPNPLFGPAWESLKQHLESRNLKQLKIAEEAKTDSTIASGLSNILGLLRRKATPAEIKDAINSSAIADQAVLMSADGYGSAKVQGLDINNKPQTLRTSDDQLSFEFQGMPGRG